MKSAFGSKIGIGIDYKPFIQKALVQSKWEIVCTGADGRVKWEEECKNLVVNQGLQTLLDVMFLAGTQIVVADWAVGLIEGETSATSASTYAVPVYTESTAYDEEVRPPYVGVRSAQTITNNASKAVFTINATKSLLGGFLVGGGAAGLHTPGDTAGSGCILYCAINFTSAKSVVDDDVVSITIVLTAADA